MDESTHNVEKPGTREDFPDDDIVREYKHRQKELMSRGQDGSPEE